MDGMELLEIHLFLAFNQVSNKVRGLILGVSFEHTRDKRVVLSAKSLKP
jgi:hypothetical protein